MSSYSKVCQALGSKHMRQTAADDSRVAQEQLPGRAPPNLILRPSCRVPGMQGVLCLEGGSKGLLALRILHPVREEGDR